jgi:non-specific serine/threonine protein kinase
LEAAEQVCSDENIKIDDVLDLMDHLVDKSLIVVEAGQGQETHYRYMETIRQYAREKLSESGESALNRNRHLAYFLKWVRGIEPGLRSQQQVELLNRLENEIDNLRAALEWAQDSDPEAGLQLASMLKWFWHLCGFYEEGEDWLENLLASSKKPGAENDPLITARSLSVLAWLSFWAGNTQTALTSLNESLELCKKYQGLTADLITADNLYLSGSLALMSGDLSQAKTLAEQGLALSHALGNKFRVAEAHSLLGGIAYFADDFETASQWRETGIVIRREIGDKDGLAYDLTNAVGIPFSLGDYENVKRMLTAAVEAGKETRNEFPLGLALGMFGVTYSFEDKLGQALDYFSQLITLAYEKSNAILKTLAINYLVLLLFKQKQYRAAIQLKGATEELKTYRIVALYEGPFIHNVRQQYLLEARETLGETDYNAAHAEGRAMTLDQATAYALKALGQ